MNISDVVNDIKLSQGLQNIALPFDKPVENVIAEILRMTVREYSEFKPYVQECFAVKKNLLSPNETLRKANIYILPPECTTTRVKTAHAEIASSSYQDEEATTNTFTVGTPFVGFGSYYPQDILNAQMTGAAINKYAGLSSQAPNSEYLGHNKIKLYNFPEQCFIKFKVERVHDYSLETLPDSCYETFVELATLDVQRTLYNNIKNMQNVGSAFKEIQLKIEDWSGAEKDQKAWMEKYRGIFHLDRPDLLTFF
jgi:hypothetical protein